MYPEEVIGKTSGTVLHPLYHNPDTYAIFAAIYLVREPLT